MRSSCPPSRSRTPLSHGDAAHRPKPERVTDPSNIRTTRAAAINIAQKSCSLEPRAPKYNIIYFKTTAPRPVPCIALAQRRTPPGRSPVDERVAPPLRNRSRHASQPHTRPRSFDPIGGGQLQLAHRRVGGVRRDGLTKRDNRRHATNVVEPPRRPDASRMECVHACNNTNTDHDERRLRAPHVDRAAAQPLAARRLTWWVTLLSPVCGSLWSPPWRRVVSRDRIRFARRVSRRRLWTTGVSRPAASRAPSAQHASHLDHIPARRRGNRIFTETSWSGNLRFKLGNPTPPLLAMIRQNRRRASVSP